jgi:hypothetical protein
VSQVPVFDARQNPHSDIPACFTSQEKARELKKSGTHYFGNHSVFGYAGVKAIIELPDQALPAAVREERDRLREESQFSGWIVAGQTSRPYNRNKNAKIAPGFPHWELAR